MSHFSVCVVTKTGSEDELKEALQPFHEYECTGTEDQYVQTIEITAESLSEAKDAGLSLLEYLAEDEVKIVKKGSSVPDESMWAEVEGSEIKVYRKTNPNAKWDWWMVGGRWSNTLIATDESGCDAASKRSIDLPRMIQSWKSEELNLWTQFDLLTSAHKSAYKPWECFLARVESKEIDINRARAEYHAQPLRKALQGSDFAFYDDISRYLLPLDECLDRRTNKALSFAFLRDGAWSGRGRMGWFACVSDEKDDWDAEFWKRFADVPDDYWVTIVDCHI